MVAGDLLDWRDKRWLVRKIDQQTQTAFVFSQEGETDILGTDEDTLGGCRVVCNPATSWPCASLPQRGHGRLLSLLLASLSGDTPLIPLVDWVKIDDRQIGGAIFLNPDLGLRYRDRLIVVYEVGMGHLPQRLPLDIPRNFLPLPQKIRPENKPLAQEDGPPDLYSYLKDDDE